MSIATTICPHCGAENLADCVTCTACGKNLETLSWVSIAHDFLTYGLAAIGVFLGGVFSALFSAALIGFGEGCKSAICGLLPVVSFFLGCGISFMLLRLCKGKLLPTIGMVALIFIVGILSLWQALLYMFSSYGLPF